VAAQGSERGGGKTLAVQIGAKPDSGFDNPIGMLIDCHRRIERFLQILFGVAERARGRELADGEKTAIEAALLYFRVGGRRHTADEEESLFPRLRAEAGASAFEELSKLESDHDEANSLHAAVDTLYTKWIAVGVLEPTDERRLLASTSRLKQLYEEHIQVEESQVFPRAANALDEPTIAEIGREFANRRR
jgi:hemerythrin-like domain-containing protein